MIASLIIDIPNRQVNQTYDYVVPSEMESSIQVGSRVRVKFGFQTRLAFVVALAETSDYPGELRAISELLDWQSYLPEELIELSQAMAEQLNAFRITVLQAMIPNVLKGKYDEVISVKDVSQLSGEITQWIKSDQNYTRQQLLAQMDAQTLNRWIRQGALHLQYIPHDQARSKTQTWIELAVSVEQAKEFIEQLDGRSYKQKEILKYLIHQTALDSKYQVLQSEVLELLSVSNSSLNALVEKQWLRKIEQQVYRNPVMDYQIEPSQHRELLPEQQAAHNQVMQAIEQKESKTYLLEGVTGSGKTEVYLQLIDQVTQRGQTAILLVPEIALTTQMIRRVLSRFDTGVAVLHSGLSVGEQFDEWQRIIRGEAKIVVGARSSIFAPLENIGIIIIDEEHEGTYKQSENPRYHARDVAKWRSEYHGCPLLLGSATPSLESRARAEVGKYQLITMHKRVNQSPLPPVKVIDLRQSVLLESSTEISPALEQAIRERLERNEQIVLLLNRRGFASYFLCRECGYIMGCPHCDISLTYHKAEQVMKCHYCNYQTPVVTQCPQCHSEHIHSHGIGTQKVEETLSQLFPGVRIIRMDNDTTRGKGKYKQLLDHFEAHQGDILLGTQMIAKGLDFENVTLVGVINADTALNLPDFRASERTFQLLTQVSGRAGRGDKLGSVIIQTYNPEHYVMHFAQKHDYVNFFYYEMKRRRLANYPPYYFVTSITVSSQDRRKAVEVIHLIKNQLKQLPASQSERLLIVGPNVDSMRRMNNYYYVNLLLKYKDQSLIQEALNQILEESQDTAKERVYIQIDHEPQF